MLMTDFWWQVLSVLSAALVSRLRHSKNCPGCCCQKCKPSHFLWWRHQVSSALKSLSMGQLVSGRLIISVDIEQCLVPIVYVCRMIHIHLLLSIPDTVIMPSELKKKTRIDVQASVKSINYQRMFYRYIKALHASCVCEVHLLKSKQWNFSYLLCFKGAVC